MEDTSPYQRRRQPRVQVVRVPSMSAHCKLCGGDAGRLSDAGMHYLCAMRARSGAPTPCLGFKCPDCRGSGVQPNFGGAMLPLELEPAAIARSIEAQFPPCPRCEGSGRVDEKPEEVATC